TFTGGQTGVDHGGGLVDPAVDQGHDAVDGLVQLVLAVEGRIHAPHAPVTFDEDVVGAVDHDLGDGLVGQQGFQHPQAQSFVDHAADQHRPFTFGQHRALAGEDVPDDLFQPDPALGHGQTGEVLEVDLLQQAPTPVCDAAAVGASFRGAVLVEPGLQT